MSKLDHLKKNVPGCPGQGLYLKSVLTLALLNTYAAGVGVGWGGVCKIKILP